MDLFQKCNKTGILKQQIQTLIILIQVFIKHEPVINVMFSCIFKMKGYMENIHLGKQIKS